MAVNEARREDRVPVTLAVNIANTECVTRDVSASGVFLESNASFVAGDRIDFAIEFDSPGGKLMLKCNGEIVRVEDRNGKMGVAVKIVESVMESAEGSIIMNSNINVLSTSAQKIYHN
jgi:hypothetical protein